MGCRMSPFDVNLIRRMDRVALMSAVIEKPAIKTDENGKTVADALDANGVKAFFERVRERQQGTREAAE